VDSRGAGRDVAIPESPSSLERVDRLLELVQGPRVLHVGCSDHSAPRTENERARWLHGRLVNAGHSVLGVDSSVSGLEWMENAGFEVLLADAQALPALGQFDTIVAGELLEHLESPGLFLEGCRRNLKDGGKLILSTPNAFGLVWLISYLKNRHTYDRIFNLEHTCWFDAQTLRQLLERKGFQTRSVSFVDDLRADAAESSLFRAFARVWPVGRAILPRRVRSTIVAEAALKAGF
jgi:2-polyprenyl-3-methyl-5-hydroxy-6-metoxy-1,4-benzoquinol methylase